MTDDSGGTTWRYDGRGQVVQENKTISGTTYTSRWSYNSASLPVTLTYPDNEVVTTTYLPQMAVNGLSGASNYVSETRYDAAGRAKTRALGSGAVTSYTYKPWSSPVGGALATIQTSNALQNLTYNYDGNGNITSLADIYNGQTETLVYEYDALNRLKAVSNALSESYDYDARGNLQIKGGQTLYYDNPAHLHAATSYNGNTYAYDANGNMTTRVVNGVPTTLTYDGENRLVGATWQNHSAQFVYDGDGKRVKSVVDGTATDYVGAHYEVKGSVVTKYYFAGGQVVALRQGGVLSYLFSDHLGSTTVTTDSSGTKTAEMRYKPWGETRYTSGTTPTARHYTGQYEESGIGLYFYNARWYDPLLGRFAQADSVIPGIYNPLDLDRYSYVRNNPVNFNDPTGHVLKDDDLGGLDPLSPTWYVDNYGDSAATINRIDIWYDTHQDYNLYADVNVWATNHGEVTARREYAQLVQSYCTWRAMNGQQDVLGQQMKEQAKKFILGTFLPVNEYFENTKGIVNTAKYEIVGPISGAVITLYGGLHLSTNNALDAAAGFLGEGYIEAGPSRWVSADGLRQVRMGPKDLLGDHGGGPHINFDTKTPIAGRPGQYQIIGMHIYYEDGWD